jgi:hypothetical protein
VTFGEGGHGVPVERGEVTKMARRQGGAEAVAEPEEAALATLGAGLDRDTVLFIGWFGPRGLASLVFALLALEELGRALTKRSSSPR